MTFAFIGMSGAGKSYSAERLSDAFRVISIDDRIAEKLNLADVSEVATWMGWPDDAGYRDRERKYLEYEIAAMNEALDEIEASEEQIILDTSGSVVYTGWAICERMQRLTTVVYFKIDEATLIQRYLLNPKPVLWGDQFDQLPGESVQDAIVRCYPRLMAHRKALYEYWQG